MLDMANEEDRERVKFWAHTARHGSTVSELANAVLALTEQLASAERRYEVAFEGRQHAWDQLEGVLAVFGETFDRVDVSGVASFVRAQVPIRQQPEPVSRRELVDLFNQVYPIDANANWVIDWLLARYTITRKQAAEPVWARAPKPDYRPEYVEDEIAAQFHRSQREHQADLCKESGDTDV